MIQPNELRIGNKIKGNVVYKGEAKTFERFNDGFSVVFFSDGSIHGIGEFLKDCEPIPLTEDWLLKFGFENITKDWYTDKCYRMTAEKTGTTFDYWLTEQAIYRNEETLLTCAYYVHHLQNLIYALTGKDLEMKK
jgi:hypothetical protein